jgi:16S rRNA (guanine527-N7)-methyltransferase
MERLKKIFTEVSPAQWELLEQMAELHREWNAKVNLVSRKDMENLVWHHYAPCVAAVRVVNLAAGAHVLDVGTGGGLPGLVLAVLFPKAQFTLADSVGKKVAVVADIAARLRLANVRALHARAETLGREYDFAAGRAVAALPQFFEWVRGRLRKGAQSSLPNGVLYWQGGNLAASATANGTKPSTVLSLEETLGDARFFEKYIAHYTL